MFPLTRRAPRIAARGSREATPGSRTPASQPFRERFRAAPETLPLAQDGSGLSLRAPSSGRPPSLGEFDLPFGPPPCSAVFRGATENLRSPRRRVGWRVTAAFRRFLSTRACIAARRALAFRTSHLIDRRSDEVPQVDGGASPACRIGPDCAEHLVQQSPPLLRHRESATVQGIRDECHHHVPELVRLRSPPADWDAECLKTEVVLEPSQSIPEDLDSSGVPFRAVLLHVSVDWEE